MSYYKRDSINKYQEILNNTPNIDKVHKVVISLSGGLDSTTLLYLMVKKLGAENVFALSFSYQQRHLVELKQASKTCEILKVQHKIIDISFLGDLVSSVSAMVRGNIATPTMGDLSAERQVPTYVPFRNMILSSMTLAYAEVINANGIALGVQYGDYENAEAYSYWDTSADFHEAIQRVADLNDKHHITFIAPFVKLKKADEIQLGMELDIPFENSWTCYNPIIQPNGVTYITEPAGGVNVKRLNKYIPCGVCPSCAGRAEAFKNLGLEDPLIRQNGVIY